MARIFITGSSDGLGQLTAELLISQGHSVVLHARNKERAQITQSKIPGAEKVLTADLSSIEETKMLASEVNVLGSFDAVIHNAAVNRVPGNLMFTVNSLAPYILTCLIKKPKRLIYLSSGMHLQAEKISVNSSIDPGHCSYSDSKLHVIILCKAVSRKWSGVYANAVNPGWVATKMGGPNAPDDLQKGIETQAWLSVSSEEKAKVKGRYFFHKKEELCRSEAVDAGLQEKFLSLCEKMSDVHFP